MAYRNFTHIDDDGGGGGDVDDDYYKQPANPAGDRNENNLTSMPTIDDGSE